MSEDVYGIQKNILVNPTSGNLFIGNIFKHTRRSTSTAPVLDANNNDHILYGGSKIVTVKELAAAHPISRPVGDSIRANVRKYLPNAGDMTGLLDLAFTRNDHAPFFPYVNITIKDTPTMSATMTPTLTMTPTMTMTPTPTMTMTHTPTMSMTPTVTGTQTIERVFGRLISSTDNSMVTVAYEDGFVGIRFNHRDFVNAFVPEWTQDPIQEFASFDNPFHRIDITFHNVVVDGSYDGGEQEIIPSSNNELLREDDATDFLSQIPNSDILYTDVFDYNMTPKFLLQGSQTETSFSTVSLFTHFNTTSNSGETNQYYRRYKKILDSPSVSGRELSTYYMFNGRVTGGDVRIQSIHISGAKYTSGSWTLDPTQVITHGVNGNIVSFDTPTMTMTHTVTPTMTQTPTITMTPTMTMTQTPTMTMTPTVTMTQTDTLTYTPTDTSTMTHTRTIDLFNIGNDTIDIIDEFNTMIIIQEYAKYTGLLSRHEMKQRFFTLV